MTERCQLIRFGYIARIAEEQAIDCFCRFLCALTELPPRWEDDWLRIAIGAHVGAHEWADDALSWAQGIDPDPGEDDSGDEPD